MSVIEQLQARCAQNAEEYREDMGQRIFVLRTQEQLQTTMTAAAPQLDRANLSDQA